MTTETKPRPSARERLLTAATELFYAEGVHTVGIDRVIERAGVAKASLYSTFGSKDELIRAYLQDRHSYTRQRMDEGLLRYETPREKLLGVFDIQAEPFDRPGYRGCAFVAANGEADPGSCIPQVTADYRGWVRGLFTDLAEAAGFADPAALAGQLHLVYEGAAIAARNGDTEVLRASRAAAAALIDAAGVPTTGGARKTRPGRAAAHSST